MPVNEAFDGLTEPQLNAANLQQRQNGANFTTTTTTDGQIIPMKQVINGKDYGTTKDVETKGDSEDDENDGRGNWTNQFEFILSCLSYAVGLGNVWRFPYLCYRNGGGAFLIPYTLALLFMGLPLFLMELAMGQFSSEGPITVWKISPLFQGVGYAMAIMSGVVAIYYNMILAWTAFYLFSSFRTQLPWETCENWWNTNACRRWDARNCTSQQGTMLANGTCIFPWTVDQLEFDRIVELKQNSRSASDEYFHNYVLDISEGIHDLGGLKIELVICLFFCWLLVFWCLRSGVKSIGKVAYFTALFPYFVLTVLLIRGVTLPGAIDGIKFYLTPEWSRLLEARVWSDAAMQIFFSLSPCWGGLITLASYNRFNNNFFKDTMTVAFGNCGTSFYAGFVIFSVVGFMARELGVEVKDVAAQGAGLAFIVYPEAVTKLPFSPFWSILFFSMLLTLGIGSQIATVETVSTSIVDSFPEKLRHRKPQVLMGICIVMFLAGTIMCTRAGMYILQLMDNHCAAFSALVIGVIELMVIAWIYGVDRFMEDCRSMLGQYPYPPKYWSALWKYGCPALIISILTFYIIDYQPASYGSYIFPWWAGIIGWSLSFVSIAAIPIIMVVKLTDPSLEDKSLSERVKLLVRPTEEWGPKPHNVPKMFTFSNNAKPPPPATIGVAVTTNGASQGVYVQKSTV